MNLLNNIRISDKLIALMVSLVFGFVLIGVVYYIQLSDDTKTNNLEKEKNLLTQALYEQQNSINQLLSLAKLQQPDNQFWIDSISREKKNLSTAERKLNKYQKHSELSPLITLLDIPKTEKSATPESINNSVESNDIFTLDPIISTNQIITDLEKILPTLTNKLSNNKKVIEKISPEEISTYTSLKITGISFVFTALLFCVAMATALGMYFIYKSIVFPMAHIQRIIRRINKGDTKARVGLKTNDELGDLGEAFNKLLDDRINNLETQSSENEKLNNSIISLIKSLGRIAQKDLTIKVPVSDDITGTISDAVNLLTKETAKTLFQVKDISEEVNTVSDQLKKQSDVVMQVADKEREQVIETTKALELATRAMNHIAKSAESANSMADKTINSTRFARETVTETVNGILNIRETISETEKRIKRLGERSQEITGIVNLINSIAERTHILALNASMHAASAGEAGKGFAVVAEEVQRLAENAREATEDISSMVNNIRIETSDTVNTMNKLISQVAEGSKLAEQAGQQMQEAESSTKELVETVGTISKNSVNQAKFANKVRDRAALIRRSTEETGEKLAEQTKHTNNLKSCSQVLVERVNMFILPEEGSTEKTIAHITTTPDSDNTQDLDKTTVPIAV